MLDLLKKDQKNLIIAPNKYHDKLYSLLLKNQNIIFDVSILSISSFFENILFENAFEINTDSTLIRKIKLNESYKSNAYYNNKNFIDELYKLEKEFQLSNLNNTSDYLINATSYDFSDIKTTYDNIIVYSNEDFYPIHDDLMTALDNKIYYHNTVIKPNYELYESNNIVNMLDDAILNIYQSKQDNILVLVNDEIIKEYLINKLDLLSIKYNDITIKNKQAEIKIRALFKYLKTKDESLLKNQVLDDNQLAILNTTTNQKEYFENLYYLLLSLDCFNLSFLNTTFKDLYLLEFDISINFLNSLLEDALISNITHNNEIKDYLITIASTNHTGVEYDSVYILDASLKNQSTKKISYLLNLEQREKISKKLINNTFYYKKLQENQEQMLNCSSNIKIYYSLVSLENAPQNLAYFITKKIGNVETNNNKIKHIVNFKSDLDLPSISTNNTKVQVKMIKALSSTSLDTFYLCPYKYFINYHLKPSQSQVSQEFSNLFLGEIYHKIMENINNYLLTNNSTYQSKKDYLVDYAKEMLDEYKEILNKEYRKNEVEINIISKKIMNNIVSLIETLSDYESYSSYNIYETEKRLEFSLNNYQQDFKFVGNVDLIMKYDNYHYVLDYKSSAKKFEEKKFLAGISNQLICYLKLLKENNYNYSGAFYKGIQEKYLKVIDISNQEEIAKIKNNASKLEGLLIDNKYLNKFDITFENDFEGYISNNKKGKNIVEEKKIIEYFDVLDNHIKGYIEMVNKGDFKILPYDTMTCEYCNYSNICKITTTSLTRKELEKDE